MQTVKVNRIPGVFGWLVGIAADLVQASLQELLALHQTAHQAHWPSSFLTSVLQAAGDAGEGFHELNAIDGGVEISTGCCIHHPTEPLGVRLPKDHSVEHQGRKLSLDVGDGLDAISVVVVTIRHEEQHGCERRAFPETYAHEPQGFA